MSRRKRKQIPDHLKTLGSIAIVLVGVGSLQAAGMQNLLPAHNPSYRAVLDQYCVTCHNQRARTAELLLDQADVEKIGQEPEVWEKVVKKLRSGTMPPAGMPRPDQATYDSLATYLETALDRAAAAHPNPGRPVLHRLNRIEYTHAVRDLLALDIDGMTLLPADDSRYGFDNIGEVLTVSPLLMERYLAAAGKISRLAVGDPDVLPVFETYNVPKYYVQEDRMNEDLPLGSRGGIAVRHHFPLDGEYIIQVRLAKNSRDYIRGIGEPHHLDVLLDGVRVKRFTIGGEKHGRSAGIFSSAAMGDPKQEVYERTADEVLEVRFPASAGPRMVGVAFVKETSVPEGPRLPRMTQYDLLQHKGGAPWVGTISIGGPYNPTGMTETPSRRKIFVCRPDTVEQEEPCAREILSTLARRAYRRPLTDQDLQTLLDFYTVGVKKGGFEEGIRRALARILVGPEFLFRMEFDPENVAPDTPYPISDLELASRLSFFLWSSIPDDQLLDLAEQGQLKDPVVLEREVRRLLTDSRSKALVINFGGQWLQLRQLRSVSPDPDTFPYFDDNLREAFGQETELFLESLIREDRSILDLLNADHTFVNERLARHYGIPNIYGSHFRRVVLTEEHRRGLLGKGSILTVTSYANRTSPVLRGKWVLDHILGTPPAPPPPNIPDLVERDQDGKALSMREALEQHRANPVCATCHSQMDPLGFALENFDGTGSWRTIDADAPIDASGILPDGTRFQGPVELQRVLIESKSEEFVNTVTEKLLTYALGRGVESYDAPAIRSIIREAAPDDYRWSSLILGIVKSTPFQMRRSWEQ
ncbi:MAG: DUF1592 domain-containing protein [Acidobacteriota bacterium]